MLAVSAYLIATITGYHTAFHFTICILSWLSAKECAGRSPKVSASYIILTIWSFCVAVTSFDSELYAAEAVAATTVFLLWEGKTLFVRPVKADPFDSIHYFYGVIPAYGMEGACNTARPSSLAEFGGRVVIGGGYVWCVHKDHFAKIPLARMDISCSVLVNTGELINKDTNRRLDAKVGTKAIRVLNDCSTISTQHSLERVLLRRWLSRYFT